MVPGREALLRKLIVIACVGGASNVLVSGMEFIAGTRVERKVLVVDDQHPVLDTLAAMLRSAGYRVSCVSSGDGALAAARLTEFDAALIDVFMPMMDGFETALRLQVQAARKGQTMRMWHMTGMNSPAVEKRSARCGMMGLLVKPFGVADLCIALEAGFDGPVPPALESPPRPVRSAKRSADDGPPSEWR